MGNGHARIIRIVVLVAAAGGAGIAVPDGARAETTALEPVADGYVGAARPDAGWGRKKVLVAGGKGRHRAFLRFAVDIADPIVGARLDLRARSGPVSRLRVALATGRLRETGLTGAGAPRRARGIPALPAGGDIARLVRGRKNVTLMLTGPAARRVVLGSREAARSARPRLIVETAAAPLPAGPAFPAPLPPAAPPSAPANAAPGVTSVTLSRDAPATDEVLEAIVISRDPDGDAVTLTHQWSRNGADLAGETGPTLDLSEAGNGDKGDQISVRVTAGDGEVVSAPVTSAPTTVANTPPELQSVVIDQASPRTEDTLTVAAVSSDADGDPRTLSHQWRKNGADLAGETGPTLDLSEAGNGDKGDQISVRVTATDGTASSAPTTSAARTVAGTPRVLESVVIEQTTPRTDDTLTVAVTESGGDTDAGPYEYQWRKNGTDLPGETGPELDLATAGNGDKGDQISVRVSAGDDSQSLTSEPRTVANTAPALTSVAIEQASPRTEDTLTVSAVSSDADGDPRTLSYQWRNNGADLAGETGPTLDLSEAGNGDKGDQISVRVTATDGTASSAPTTSAARTIVNSPPVIESVVIEPATARTGDRLSLAISSRDDDSDPRSLAQQWRKNGADLAGETGPTLDLSEAGNGDKGDQITARVSAGDGTATSAAVTSAPRVVANSAPACEDVALAVAEDAAGQVAPHCADADGDALGYAIVEDGEIGTATVLGAELRYTPDADENGTDEATYEASDGAATGTARLTVEVSEVNDPPVVVLDDRSGAAAGSDAPITIDAAANDLPGGLGEEGQTLAVCGVVDPPDGTAGVNAEGFVTYRPDDGFEGEDVFAYEVCDDGTTEGEPDMRSAIGEIRVQVEALRTVTAAVETDPVPHSGDAADDAAVWVNPEDPSASTVIGTDKDGGLAVYDLSGDELQYVAGARFNNVDLRGRFDWDGVPTAVAAATDITNNRVALFRVDPATGLLQATPIGTIPLPYEPYGICLYESPRTGRAHAFVTVNAAPDGTIEQYELDTTGGFTATLVRTLDVGRVSEGCVADDHHARLYASEEDVAVWVYDAEPDGGATRRRVDAVGGGGHLKQDLEGLAIAEGADGKGFLFVSSQGNDSYAVYRRDGRNEFVTHFQIGDGAIDGTVETDGIEVVTAGLGPAFPHGLFIAQDGCNDGEPPDCVTNQNFKFVALEDILGERLDELGIP